MFIFAVVALASASSFSIMSPDEQQVMGANMEYATGDTSPIKQDAPRVTVKPKTKSKPIVTLIPRDNGLGQIIARVKRENGIKTKS